MSLHLSNFKCRFAVGQLSVNCWYTAGRQLASRLLGELFFTFTICLQPRIASLRGRCKKGSGMGREKSTKEGKGKGAFPSLPNPPPFLPFLSIPYPFRRLKKRSNLAAEAQVCGNPDVCVSPLLSECTSKLELRVKQHY